MKKVKILYMGKRLKDIYPYATKWQVFKYNIMKLFQKILIASFVIGLIVGSFKLGSKITEVKFVRAQEGVQEILVNKIDTLKEKVVTQIQKCESAGLEESDGILVFDSNKKASIGTMQFQKTTVIHYYKILYGKDITPKEAVLIALDDEKATELAKKIMFETKNMAGKDWVNCSKKYGSDNQIELIKDLEN